MATITFLGKPVNTCGDLPAVGSQAPDFTLTSGKLTDVTLAKYSSKKKIFNITFHLADWLYNCRAN